MSILLLLALFLQTPDPTIPTSVQPLLTAKGEGVQIYRCTQQSDTYTWVFVSPEATLTDPTTHQPLGTHGAGPSWTWKDGSAITGTVLQKTPSPDSIPWLLLQATPKGATTGALTPITQVRRSDTHGGNAPATGCDATHPGTLLRVPYTATYTFYGPAR